MNRKTDTQARQPVAEPQTAAADDSWLHRWSQRKLRAEHSVESDREVVTGRPAATQVSGEAGDSAPKDVTDEVGEAEEPELPPIESLDEHSDYRGFMSEKVSEDLRLQALRKLFSLPQFNVRDGLNDYDEDFASFKPMGDIVPHDMARSLERAVKKAAGPAGQDEPAKTAGVQTDQQVPDVEQLEQSGGEDGAREVLDSSDDALPRG
jgi:hypothetical protein